MRIPSSSCLCSSFKGGDDRASLKGRRGLSGLGLTLRWYRRLLIVFASVNRTDRPNGTAFALNLSDELSGEGYSSATLPGEAKFGSEPSLHVRGNNFADTWVHFI